MSATDNPEWVADCMKWRGEVLTGTYVHWCPEWDGLPIDETTFEWPCECGFKDYKDEQLRAVSNPLD